MEIGVGLSLTMRNGQGSSGAPPVAVAEWNPSDIGAGVSLSSANHTAGGSGGESVRSVKGYADTAMRVAGFDATTAFHFGLSNEAFPLTGSPGGSNAGESTNSISCWSGDGNIYQGGSGTGNFGTPRAGAGHMIALGHGKLWMFNANTGLWNNDILANQNPATNTGGISMAFGSGPWFLNFSAIGGSITLVAPPAIPSGFSAWEIGDGLLVPDVPAAPLSVTAPSVGTPLDDVWALLDETETGPQTAYPNGAWAGSIDEYLGDMGVSLNNVGDLFINLGDGVSKTLEGYDFGNKNVRYQGDGATVTLNDCGGAGEFGGNFDGNMNQQAAKTITQNYTNHDFRGTGYAWLAVSNGAVNVHRSRYRNQVGLLAYIVFGRAFHLAVSHTENLITGGGQNPDFGWHGELFQNLTASSSYVGDWVWDRNMVDFNENQVAIINLWTAMFSLGDYPVTLSNSIFRGLKAMQDAGSTLNAVLGYADETVGRGCFLDNCIIEDGVGVSIKHSGGVLKPTISGNRRLESNTPITLADCG